MKDECKWQWGLSDRLDQFKLEAMTPLHSVRLYGFVQEGSPYIHVLHGLGQIFSTEVPAEVNAASPLASLATALLAANHAR